MAAALLVAALLLAYSIGSQRVGFLQSCHQLPAAASQSKPASTCEPVGATTAPILLGALLIVLLLLPDFGEVVVPGLVTLKRRVEDQDRRQDLLEQRLEANLTQTTSVTYQHEPTVVDGATFRAATERVSGVEADAAAGPEDGAERNEPIDQDQSQTESDRAERTVELISIWERLARAETLADAVMRRDAYTIGLSASAAERLVQWSVDFSKEREYVRLARNAVAHDQPIDLSTLRQAVELALTLEAALPPLPSQTTQSLHGDALAFVERVGIWLDSLGFERGALTTTQPIDFAGLLDGARTVVEAKLTRRAVSPKTLRDWLSFVDDIATSTHADRAILAVSAPEFTTEALALAESERRASKLAEIYLEVEPGEFRQLFRSSPPSA